jgi:phosphoenolpyruvate carboxykinase (ATP)
MWHPTKYAELLAQLIREHNSRVWLVNTGWTGGAYGVGKRMSLKATRAIIDAIHDGSLDQQPTQVDPVFGMEVPTTCPNVDSKLLWPRDAWSDGDAYDSSANRLAELFHQNFKQFESGAIDEIIAAGPKAASLS